MKILGFEIRRAPAGERRGFLDAAQSFRRASNFTAMPGLSLANPMQAMGLPAVFLCVDKIDKTIATLPKIIVDETDPERPKQLLTLPMGRMLKNKPNGWQNGHNFWKLTSNRKLLWGNFYAEIQRDVRTGAAVGLWPLLSQDCIPDTKAGQKIYRVGGRELADDDIFHLMGPSWNGLQGLSLISLHRKTVSASDAMQEFTTNFYEQGVRLSGFVKHPNALEPPAADRLRADIKEMWQGGSNAGSVGVLEEGMSFEPWTMPLGDAEFIATKRFGIADVARIFDMPLHKLGEIDGMKYNNVEQGNISFVIDCIEPHLDQICTEATNKLFADVDRGRLALRIPTDELLQGDLLSRMQALSHARQWSVMTINEARRKVGLPAIGPEGDQLFVPGNANAAAPKTKEARAVPGAADNTEE
ncbi:phage portal protein [Sandarakinorhabdus sp.]|uniref:phage portal protein n=1 Tax=Sandarakinorhabdus sp. TaxID=1916663 RepID=UPI00286E1798|nr:phage portal protein [Sandarakinorhabdus sp.]